MSFRSALVGAGGDAFDVEFLHDDKEDRDGDGHQHAARAEQREVVRKQSENQNRLCPYGRADRPVEQAVFFALNDGIDKAIYCQDKGQF